jgi:hypothetical protein
MIKKEKNSLPKPSTSIWMKFFKGINRLIKNYISRNIDSPTLGLKAFEPLVILAIAKENAMHGSKRKLPIIVWR